VFPKGDIDAIIARKMNVFDWIEKAKALRVEGLELWSGMFWEVGDHFVDRVAESLDAAGFEMPMLCVSPDFTNPDPQRRAEEFYHEVEMMRTTARLGGAGAATRVLSGQRHPGVSREQGLEWVIEAINALLPRARELDITLAIENHYKDSTWEYPEFAQRADVFLDLINSIDDTTHFGVQYDPSNAIVAGEDSAEFLERIVGRVVTVQASDRALAPGASLDDLRQSDGTLGYSPLLHHGAIGSGLNDYPRIFGTLSDAGYDGWISIEDGVNSFDELRQSVDFLRDARERYFGGSTALRVQSQDDARRAAGLTSLTRPNMGLSK